MRVTMALWFLAAISGCSSNSGALGPDATPPTSVHDMLAVGCDQAWASTGSGVAPKFCERACATPPVSAPCGGKTPCYDKPTCNVARRADADPATCDHAFAVTDTGGPHVGCCYEHSNSPTDPTIYFAECAQ